MSEIEVLRADLVQQSGAVDISSVLMRLEALPVRDPVDTIRPSSAMLSALGSLCRGSAELQAALRLAARAGDGLVVTFPPDVVKGLQSGAFSLMRSSKGVLPTAVNSSGKIVAHATVVSGAGAAGVAGAATGGAGAVAATASASALAVAALPIVIAGAAAYAQQQQLERSLKDIKEIVQRIEERLEDTDSGACDAAERFLELAQDALADGGLTEYLRLELAVQRTTMEGLYSARRQWVDRFKSKVEREQIERERSKGRGQPWVDSVADAAKSGKLEEELTLFIRSLLSRTKLGVLAAVVLAEENRGTAAMKLMNTVEVELRSEFFDLHNRLSPLARIAPEQSLMQRVPGVRSSTLQAHETVKALVAHLNEHVLPSIPDPHSDREVRAALGPETVEVLVSEIDRFLDEATEDNGSVVTL